MIVPLAFDAMSRWPLAGTVFSADSAIIKNCPGSFLFLKSTAPNSSDDCTENEKVSGLLIGVIVAVTDPGVSQITATKMIKADTATIIGILNENERGVFPFKIGAMKLFD